jgi:hypothetical protein
VSQVELELNSYVFAILGLSAIERRLEERDLKAASEPW